MGGRPVAGGADHQPLDSRRIAALAPLLRRSQVVESEYTASDFTWGGEPGSPAAGERTYGGPDPAKPWAPRIVDTAYASVRVGLVAAAEQLATMAKVIEEPTPGGVGVMVMARSIVEICARAAWIMEPGIGPRGRVARSLGDQLYSAYHATKLATALDLPGGADGFSPPPDELTTKIEDLGLTVKAEALAYDPRITVDGTPRPSASKLVRSLFRGSVFDDSAAGIYPNLSAFTHGTHFGLMHFYRETGEYLNGEKVLNRVVDQRDIEAAAGLSMVGWAAAMRQVVSLTRWGYIRIDMYQMAIEKTLYAGPLAAG